MKTYYQVLSRYALSHNKPQLVSVSLNTTSEYYPYLVGSASSFLSHSRYFHTVAQAQAYISYLFSRYPTSTATRPVLNATQLLLF